MKVRATAVAALLLLGGVAACGGDDDDSGGGERSKEAFCDVNQQIDDKFNETFSEFDEDTTNEEIEEAVVTVATEIVDEGLIDEARDTAPEEVQDEVAILGDAVEKSADGDAQALQTDEVDKAGTSVDDYCGVEDEDGE
jgi:hypothetical protein